MARERGSTKNRKKKIFFSHHSQKKRIKKCAHDQRFWTYQGLGIKKVFFVLTRCVWSNPISLRTRPHKMTREATWHSFSDTTWCRFSDVRPRRGVDFVDSLQVSGVVSEFVVRFSLLLLRRRSSSMRVSESNRYQSRSERLSLRRNCFALVFMSGAHENRSAKQFRPQREEQMMRHCEMISVLSRGQSPRLRVQDASPEVAEYRF